MCLLWGRRVRSSPHCLGLGVRQPQVQVRGGETGAALGCVWREDTRGQMTLLYRLLYSELPKKGAACDSLRAEEAEVPNGEVTRPWAHSQQGAERRREPKCPVSRSSESYIHSGFSGSPVPGPQQASSAFSQHLSVPSGQWLPLFES